MIEAIIISTMCLVSNGVSSDTIKSGKVFEIPEACLTASPCRATKSCKVFSDGSFSYSDGCNTSHCGPTADVCITTNLYCPPPAWWEESNLQIRVNQDDVRAVLEYDGTITIPEMTAEGITAPEQEKP